MARTVVAMFDTLSEAQDAVQDLVDNGIPRDHISLVGSNARGEYTTHEDQESAAAEGAGAGAVGGSVVGGVLGLLVGIGALAIPGIGPVIAAGPLVAALGTAAAGAGIGAAAGGLLGALVGAGIPEEEAHLYAEGVRRGGSLVTVSTDESMASTAYNVLRRHNAVDVDERGQVYREQGWERFDPDATPYTESSSYNAYAGAGSHPSDSARSDWEESSKVGTAAGTVAGAATGAAIGSAGGPVGTVVGGVAGAAVGAGVGAAGDAAGEAAEDAAQGEDDTRVRSDAVDTMRPDYDESTRPLSSAGAGTGYDDDTRSTTGADTRTRSDVVDTMRSDYDESTRPISSAGAGTGYDDTRSTTSTGDYRAGTVSSATLGGTTVPPRSQPRMYDTESRSRVDYRDDTDTGDSAKNEWQESSKVGTAGGTVAGAATGAAIGAAGGPVGSVVGGVAGAAVGGGVGAAGDAAGEAAEDEMRGEDDAPIVDDDERSTGRKGQVDPGV